MQLEYQFEGFTLQAAHHKVSAEEILHYYIRNKTHLENSMPLMPEEFYTLEFWQDKQMVYAKNFKMKKSFRYFLIEESRKVIGSITLDNIMYGAFMAGYLGYGLDAERQGRGIMTGVLKVFCQEIFETIGLNRVMANCVPENEKSLKVLERVGFEKEGFGKRYLKLKGEWKDHVLLGLVRGDGS